jgi:protein phosphatase
VTSIEAAAQTHTGYVRSSNQDFAVVSSDLFAVADGIGGNVGGDVAARTAIEELVVAFGDDKSAAGLVAAVQRANRAIWEKSRSNQALHGMGTTLTAAALVPEGDEDENHLALVNIGDSRAYRLQGAADGAATLSRLTEDHSVAEEMVRQGELTPAEAAVHPHRHVLTRALGMDRDVDLDIWDLEASPGTRFLLCSDGLTDDVAEEEIAGILSSAADPDEAAKQLVAKALGHGGRDNVTVVVIDVVDSAAESARREPEMVPAVAPDDGEEESDAVGMTASIPAVRPSGEAAVVGASGQPETAETAATGTLFDQLDAASNPLSPARAGTAPAEPVHAPRTMTMVGGRPLPPGDEGRPGRRRRMPRRGDKPAKPYKDRVFSVRAFLFLLVLAAIAAGIVGVTIWFQRSSYYVGLSSGRVSIYQGRPGGLIWFKPQLLQRSALRSDELLPNSVDDLRSGITETSLKAARAEVRSLFRLSKLLGMLHGKPASTAAFSSGPGPLRMLQT